MKGFLNEKKLIYRVRNKQDAEAFGKLYDFYVEPIYRFVYFKLSNKEDAEDATSDVFLKTWQYLINQTQKDVVSFRSLIFTIARNKIVDVYRLRSNNKECPIDSPKIEVEVRTERLDNTVSTKIEVDNLLETIKTLKQEYQDILHLKHVEGFTISEIASILGKNKTNVRVILHRATKKLKLITGYE